ncbi:hypothetical protein CYA_0054 [Synechococcus sp. JA-3-3Ab]|nr:hypothetical protein CYA_0054 [Synechococcus sp. JA-3-3Ab]
MSIPGDQTQPTVRGAGHKQADPGGTAGIHQKRTFARFQIHRPLASWINVGSQPSPRLVPKVNGGGGQKGSPRLRFQRAVGGDKLGKNGASIENEEDVGSCLSPAILAKPFPPLHEARIPVGRAFRVAIPRLFSNQIQRARRPDFCSLGLLLRSRTAPTQTPLSLLPQDGSAGQGIAGAVEGHHFHPSCGDCLRQHPDQPRQNVIRQLADQIGREKFLQTKKQHPRPLGRQRIIGDLLQPAHPVQPLGIGILPLLIALGMQQSHIPNGEHAARIHIQGPPDRSPRPGKLGMKRLADDQGVGPLWIHHQQLATAEAANQLTWLNPLNQAMAVGRGLVHTPLRYSLLRAQGVQ